MYSHGARPYRAMFNMYNSRGEPMISFFTETLAAKELVPALEKIRDNIERTGGKVRAHANLN